MINSGPFRVGYLVNQYPKTSHSFIRREIEALEALGVKVSRFTVRPTGEPLADAADQRELELTRAILSGPYAGKLWCAVLSALSSPGKTLSALCLAVKLGWRSDRGLLAHLAYVVEALILARWLAVERVQHLHAHFGTNSAMLAMLVHELTGIPWSFTVHGPEEFDRVTGIALAEKARRADFVVAISSFGRSQLWRWLDGKQWPKVHVVRCGLDAAFLGATTTPLTPSPRLLCIGRLCEQKGQLLLVEAAARLKAKGVGFELVLVGDGPMRPDIEAVIAEHGLGSCVRITGWLSGQGVRGELEACRLMVLPSFAEGLPVVIMEAMALRRPVLTTAIAGIPELVRDGETGFLVPAGDIEQLVAKIEAILAMSDAQLSHTAGAARDLVLRQHDVNIEAQKLRQLFADVAR